MKLTNKEILLAGQAFARLNAIKFPVKTGMALVKVGAMLDKHLDAIEKMRQSFVRAHAPTDEKGVILPIRPDTPEMDAFNKDWVELLEMDEDIGQVVPVKLPEKIAATCDKCHHNMDKTFEIEPEILKPLVMFVE